MRSLPPSCPPTTEILEAPPRYRVSKARAIRTASPSPLLPRTCLGMASRVSPALPRPTLVVHVTPSTVARPGVRPHPWVTRGANASGTGANVQPPFPGICRSRAVNSPPYRPLITGARLSGWKPRPDPASVDTDLPDHAVLDV